jgi:hypothetical protein
MKASCACPPCIFSLGSPCTSCSVAIGEARHASQSISTTVCPTALGWCPSQARVRVLPSPAESVAGVAPPFHGSTAPALQPHRAASWSRARPRQAAILRRTNRAHEPTLPVDLQSPCRVLPRPEADPAGTQAPSQRPGPSHILRSCMHGKARRRNRHLWAPPFTHVHANPMAACQQRKIRKPPRHGLLQVARHTPGICFPYNGSFDSLRLHALWPFVWQNSDQ